MAWSLGDRSLQSAADLRASLPKGYRGRATRSDFWDAYAAAFPKKTHRCCGKADGETNHVERWFGTLRARLSRLVRRVYSFSKHAENHLDAIHLFIATYNLTIQQKQQPGNHHHHHPARLGKARLITDVRVNNVLDGSLDLEALQIFSEQVSNAEVISLPHLHAKVYVADNDFAFVTLVNLTQRGLELVMN